MGYAEDSEQIVPRDYIDVTTEVGPDKTMGPVRLFLGYLFAVLLAIAGLIQGLAGVPHWWASIFIAALMATGWGVAALLSGPGAHKALADWLRSL